MSSLIDEVQEAADWVSEATATNRPHSVFGKIVGAVLWTDEAGPEGEPLVGIDPSVLVADIGVEGLPLFSGHDPGFPIGQTLAAKLFTTSAGVTFIAAVIGLYESGSVLRFRDLGVDRAPLATSPTHIEELRDDCWLTFAVDSSAVETEWSNELLTDPPLPVERIETTHNSAESSGDLIRVGLVYLALVWNPFVTAVATEAGKHVYTKIHSWLRKLWDKVAERHNPIVELQSFQNGCRVAFLFRGKDVGRHYAAHDSLPIAAAQAARLIANMNAAGHTPSSLVYEFETDTAKWHPSFATLHDGRLIGEPSILIALEQVPTGMSLGVRRGKRKASDRSSGKA